ncbi:MAG: FAD-dependent oxidoreductase [Methylococcus sp.]|nr:MAG: FAD-dependent oxidoreductase [Methylococcus sp.]
MYAAALGRRARKDASIEITLVDASPTHIWKPLLHEVAAGTLDTTEELEYLSQARWRYFNFRLGTMECLDREKKEIVLSPTLNEEGEELISRRSFSYDTLVIAVGSVSNSFGIPGVEKHCQFLDNARQAFKFQKHLIQTFMRIYSGRPSNGKGMSIAIIGAGATGVELAAELHNVTRQLAIYGLDENKTGEAVKISLIEAADRLLPALPDRLSGATARQLGELGIQLMLGRRVVEVTESGVMIEGGEKVPADIKVWAAGIKGPDWLCSLDGLQINSVQQLMVEETLQTTRDENIFAIGDCAACAWAGHEGNVPPRAQAAHQQAILLSKSLVDRVKGKALKSYRYKDYGSLVSLGKYSTVGNLMGSVSVGGFIARVFYLSLYKMHQIEVHGYFKTAMLTLATRLRKTATSHIKLH